MDAKKDIVPIIIAAGIALVVTGALKIFVPTGATNLGNNSASKKELPLPDIPLMVNQSSGTKQDRVLIVAKDIKKDTKITANNTAWKKWPRDAVQPYFIAKDDDGAVLNNGADYTNALKMWANSDIPAGVPLTMRMLTKEDPVEREKAKKAQLEAEKKKKEQEEREKEKGALIKKGMRAITFPIDSRSASSVSLISLGDYVDIIIMERVGNVTRAHKYSEVKVLAIDGVAKVEKQPSKEGGKNTSGFSSGKNITLEINESQVETMIRQVGNGGLILSVRSQMDLVESDKSKEEDEDFPDEITKENSKDDPNSNKKIKSPKGAKKTDKEGGRSNGASDNGESAQTNDELIKSIISLNNADASEALRKKEEDIRNEMMLMSCMNYSGGSSADALIGAQGNISALVNDLNSNTNSDNAEKGTSNKGNADKKSGDSSKRDSGNNPLKNDKSGDEKMIRKNPQTGKYEIVSGKIVGEDRGLEEKSVIIYRQLKAAAIKFDIDGRKIDGR